MHSATPEPLTPTLAAPALTSAGVMQRLRDETTPHHKLAESRPLEQSLVQGTAPRSVYVAVLEQRFVIHRALEAAVASFAARSPIVAGIIDPHLFQEVNARRDLEFFGVDAATVSPLAATRELVAEIERLATTRPMALLGVYYVFEGSKNGARYIARALRRSLELPPNRGTQYFDPHGEQQRPLWQQFKERMDAAAFAPADIDAMVAAAKRTFELLAAIDDELLAVVPHAR